MNFLQSTSIISSLVLTPWSSEEVLSHPGDCEVYLWINPHYLCVLVPHTLIYQFFSWYFSFLWGTFWYIVVSELDSGIDWFLPVFWSLAFLGDVAASLNIPCFIIKPCMTSRALLISSNLTSRLLLDSHDLSLDRDLDRNLYHDLCQSLWCLCLPLFGDSDFDLDLDLFDLLRPQCSLSSDW